MSDIDGSTRSKNGENAGVVKASGVSGSVVDPGAVKPWAARASEVGDNEGVLGKGVQDSTGVVEEFEGLVASVHDGRCDLQVLHSIDIDAGS